MKYEELNKLWQDQRKRDQDWHHDLIRSAVALRNSVAELIAPPNETWQEFNTKATHRYVDVINFYGLKKSERGNPGALSSTGNGVLIFGIGITFDNGHDTFPKQDLFVPVACKYVVDAPVYSFFNRDTDSSDGDWVKGPDQFAVKLVKRYKEYLSHDAYQGFETRAKIGFCLEC
jgi:hypothetical protein